MHFWQSGGVDFDDDNSNDYDDDYNNNDHNDDYNDKQRWRLQQWWDYRDHDTTFYDTTTNFVVECIPGRVDGGWFLRWQWNHNDDDDSKDKATAIT